jgi:chromosome segregation protein
MKLQSLRLQGFKSFADRTTLEFRDGVTAIIGSNGCGKSNIADGIRWVLGEQRASAMRGAKMEEVIFQGTARRRALNFAEVSLLFDNQAGRVPVPQSEIEVTRKVFREGGSEYSLNRNACRLKDIHGLLRDTGLGSNAYAIIESTMIDTLLSDRADERRALFEEAAGIGKYKDSRQGAMRRLEAAEADLTRLDDLLAEVESKVRSLSRQKRKVERQRELQARRLDLEIAIAREELRLLETSLAVSVGRRLELEEQERSASAERATAEISIEERRVEVAEVGRQRTASAGRLDELRRQLDTREREVLVAKERRSHAELRIRQLVDERQATQARIDALGEEIAGSRAERDRLVDVVESARAVAEARGEVNAEVRGALLSERAATEAASAQAREVARRIATAEGERAGAERRRRDALQDLAVLSERLQMLRLELGQLTGQTELWQTRADEVRDRVAAAVDAHEISVEEVRVLRGREQRARDEARLAEDRVSTMTVQVEAREVLERSYEGFSPAVAAIMADRGRFPGVYGPLADYLGASEGEAYAAGVETFLGPLLQALVVADLATARTLRDWFRGEWSGGGTLVLLPLDSLSGAPPNAGSPGTPWVDLFLADFEIVSGDPLEETRGRGARAGAGGVVVDPRGVVRLVELGEGQGILARREALVKLREELSHAQRIRETRLAERDSIRLALQAAEELTLETQEMRRVAEAQLKATELDAATHLTHRARLAQEAEALEAKRVDLEQVSASAAEQIETHATLLADLTRQVEEAGSAEVTARARLQELEARWDEAREEEAELRIAFARVESELRECERRLEAAERSRAAAESRMVVITREAEELLASLDTLSGVDREAAGDIDSLFEARDRESGALALLDGRLAELDSDLAELGERARVARRREMEASEERHRVELQVADTRSKIERVRERLEAEWGRPWSALVAEAGDPGEGDTEGWRRQLRETAEQLDSLGPINMLAVEEHAEEERRLEFLSTQRTDLVDARDNLTAAIRQINRTAREVFLGTFDAVRTNFQRTFQSLFHGGECDIWLADPDDPLESAVEIQASPGGKKTQRIHLLSGGERTLTALALLFALYLVKPSPFCVLDEVDAPLDESNVGRFIQLLQDFKGGTQFIVITHNPRTMEAADWVYGVTMEEPGVSSIVGVELLGTLPLDASASPAA